MENEKNIPIEDGSEELNEAQTAENTTEEEGLTEENTVEIDEEAGEESAEPDSEKDPLDVALDEITILKDQLLRTVAEFENYKKRTQKESLDKYNYITSDVINKILPVMDNLQNAVNAKTEDKAYQEGVKMVLDQLNNCFRNLNVEEIVATPGTKFDPEYHEAVQHLDDPSKGVNEIIQEFRKGYKIGLKVIRHAMVIVAN